MQFKFMFPRVLPALALAGIFSSSSLSAADRELMNAWDVRDELEITTSLNATFVKENLPSFYDYLDTVLFHPTAGYYSSGRVDFNSHFRTFPIVLSPAFGQMLAEQMFKMWKGMVASGTLRPNEKFTMAEFGAGTGAMAEAILGYIDQQALTNPEWKRFKDQSIYACYDRSPALSTLQRKRNARFGSRFEAREGDATNPAATIRPGTLKGVILSNELPDCFSVHKVILSATGGAEVAFSLPSLPKSVWTVAESNLSAADKARIAKDDTAIYQKLIAPAAHDRVYLSRFAFNAVLDALNKLQGYEENVNQIHFQEVYVPTSVFPDLADYMKRYARPYAYSLARNGKGMVTYVNLNEGLFIKGAGAALGAGYVITIDYGYNWDGNLEQNPDHLRMYGPGASQIKANPYHSPTLNDMTTDVNFSHMAAEGESVGLKPLYFGPQSALETGTPINVNAVPRAVEDPGDYETWAGWFYSWEVYKMLVQQKTSTDAAYKYPQPAAESLEIDESILTAAQRAKMLEIEKKLKL